MYILNGDVKHLEAEKAYWSADTWGESKKTDTNHINFHFSAYDRTGIRDFPGQIFTDDPVFYMEYYFPLHPYPPQKI